MNHITTFYSVSDALHLEKVLKENGSVARMVPVPRQLSASCGYAIECKIEDCSKLQSLIDKNNISIENCFKIEIKDKKRTFLVC